MTKTLKERIEAQIAYLVQHWFAGDETPAGDLRALAAEVGELEREHGGQVKWCAEYRKEARQTAARIEALEAALRREKQRWPTNSREYSTICAALNPGGDGE